MSVSGLSASEINYRVLDLTEKYPCGPNRRLRKQDYTQVVQYVSVYKRDTKVSVLRPGTRGCDDRFLSFFGYSPVELFKLRCDGFDSEAACVTGIRIRRNNGMRVDRRDGRVLWIRLEAAYDWVMKNGTEGVWRARYREAPISTPLEYGIFFHGINKAAIEAQIAVLAPMLDVNPSWRPEVHFIRLGTPGDAVKSNAALAERLVTQPQQRVARCEGELARAQADLKRMSSIAAQMMGAVMLGVETPGEEASSDAA